MSNDMFGPREGSNNLENTSATPAAGEDRELDNFVWPKRLESKRTEIEDVALDKIVFEIRRLNNDGNKGSEYRSGGE